MAPTAAVNPVAPKTAGIEGKRARQAQAATRLSRDVQVDFDAAVGSPSFVTSTRGFLASEKGGANLPAARLAEYDANDRLRVVKAFIAEHAALFAHGPQVLDAAPLTRDYETPHNGMRTYVWQQEFEGLRVFESTFQAHITRAGELVNVASRFVPEPQAAARRVPPIDVRAAVAAAGRDVGEALDAAQVAVVEPPIEPPIEASRRQKLRSTRLLGVSAELVWLPHSEVELELCWEIVFTSKSRAEMFRTLVAAADGAVRLRQGLTESISDATYLVFTSDSPSPFSPGHPTPLTAQPAQVARTSVTTPALNVTASPNGWIDDGVNETRGNNVDAHTDTNADDVADLPRPQGSPTRVFAPPLDLTQAPSTYRDAAVVDLFYWCNRIHDRFYELGFTEAAGNFQNNNFGRGGTGNDAVLADAQDGSGTNNANFSTPPDGSPGRMQMYVFNGPTPDRDGDFDHEIVIHEYTHGLSNRLVGGGVGLSALASRGMGEGWSDFYALCLLSEAGDNVNGNYAKGGYATYLLDGMTTNYFFGIRRYPYSTDAAKNPLTFRDIDPSQASAHAAIPLSPRYASSNANPSAVHGQGEVWCNTLWGARANLIARHGFPAGNDLILQLVTDGMKLAPANPNFVQARNAILQADSVNNGGANHGELWTAFAARGLGASATAPASTTTAGVVESFAIPDDLAIAPLTASTPVTGMVGGPFTPATATYTLTNTGTAALTWTATETAAWLDLSATSGTLAPGANTTVVASILPSANALVAGSYTGAITFTNTFTDIEQTRTVALQIEPLTNLIASETWESGGAGAAWAITGTGTHRTLVTTANAPHGGSYHLTMDSSTDVTLSRNEATWTVNLAGRSNVQLRFWVQMFSDEAHGPPATPFIGGADFDGVAISADGNTWYEVQPLRTLVATWTRYVVDLDAAIAARGLSYNSTFKIRFNHYDDYAIATDGFAFDDIDLVEVLTNGLTLTLPASVNENAAAVTATVTAVPIPTSDLAVSLVSNLPGELGVPASVTIPAGQNTASFALTPIDDSVLNGTRKVTITATAAGLPTGTRTIDLTDNETTALTVTLPIGATEGDTGLTGTVTTADPVGAPIAVALSSNDPSELTVPPMVTIPAGQNSTVFPLTVVDDSANDETQVATVTASVAGWTPGSRAMSIFDNDDAIYTITAADRGWYDAIGTHTTTNTNYSTAWSATPAPGRDFRAFFIFAIPALAPGETISSAELRLDNPVNGYASPDPTESLQFQEVSTPIGTLTGGTGGVAAFNDLGDGPAFGNRSVSATDNGTTIVIPLNSAFIAQAAAAAGSQLAVGAQLTTLTRTPNVREGIFGFSTDANVTQLVLTTSNNRLTVTLPPSVMEGGAAGQGTVTVAPMPASDLVVTLVNSQPAQLNVPATVTISAGQVSVDFPISAVNDALLDGSPDVQVNASLDGYQSVPDVITVLDDETATLTLTLPVNATEGDAPVSGTLTVSAPVGADVSVALASSAVADVTVPASVTIPAGQTSASVPVTIVNDTRIDGAVPATITATVANWISGSANITALDNEASTLALTTPGALREGGTSVNVTVSIPGTLSANLVVALSSSDTTEATVPASATILAGQTSTTFAIAPVDDPDADGAQSVTITATASAFTSATTTANVADNDAHHFTLSAVPSPQSPNAPFALSVAARDVNDVTITTFNSPIALSAAGTGGALAVSPATITGWVNGVWSGTPSIGAAGTNVVLTASDGQGHTGTSNAFDVVAGLPQRFAWSTIASPQFVDGPFPVTLRAVDFAGNIAPTFTGTASLAATPIPTPRTIGTGTLTTLAPFHGSYHEYRLQTLYPASEVGTATTFNALALNIATASTSTFNNFTVRLKHTALTTLTGTAFDTTGWTEVFRGNVVPGATGWMSLLFTTPFAYDGTSSLLVDFTFDNPGTATTAYTYYTSLSNRALYSYSSGTTGDPRTWTTAIGTTSVVPNLRLFPAPSGALPVAPATTGAFVNGEWIGQVSVPFASGGIALRATSGALSGDSNAFAVQTAQLPSGTGTVFAEDFESGVLNSAFWAATGTGPFRTQVTTANLPHGGTRHLTMDSSVDGTNARNEATLTLNLAGRTGVVLRFWAKMFLDEPNGPPTAPFVGGADFDGVAMSADGTNWWEVQALRSPTITDAWAEFTVNLDAAIAARGIAYNGAFMLRFNQFDNYTITTDGIAIDDLVVTANVPPSSLTVTAPAQVVEGSGAASASVAISSAPASDLVLTLSSKSAAKIAVPPSVTIPAGQTLATFPITVLDDPFVDGAKTVILTATGPGLAESGAAVQVLDNDGGALTLTLPAMVSESTSAISGTVQLSVTPLVPISIALTSNDPGELSVPANVTVAAGQTSASFTAFTSDDGLVDGPQSVTVTAVSPGWSQATANVSVLDSGRDATLDWPTFGHGPGHNGYQPVTLGTNSFQPAWTRSFAPSSVINQVAVGGGKVFVTPATGFADTYLSALDVASGTEVWRKPFASANSINPPTFHDGKVYVQRGNHGTDTQLWCVAAASGTTVWSAPHGAQWERYFAPTVKGDGVWINGGSYGGLYGFNTGNGTQRFFNSSLEQYDEWTPTWHNGTIYTWIAGIFRAHDPATGVILWSLNLGWTWSGWSMNTVSVASENQAFVVGSPNFYAIDLSTRAAAWTATGTFRGTPAVANGKVYVITGSDVRAYDRATGALVRTYSTGNTAIAGQPIVTDDTLIVAATANTYIFDLATGALRQTLAAGGEPSLANGVLYLTSGGIVQTFRPAGQSVLTVSLPATTVGENSAPLTATVALSAAPASDTAIRLSAGGSLRATVPASVTISAGQTSATFPVTIIDDTLLNGSEVVGISASAATHLILSDTADLAVTDDETAILTLSAPASTTEGATALTGTLTLSAAPSGDVTVDLTSSDTTELTVPASVFVNAGQTSVTFPITVINDTLIDGPQTVQLTASVPGWTSGSATVSVLDNETNTLTFTAPTSITEGASGTGTITLGGTLVAPLTVDLTSSLPAQATVPLSITIATGASSGTFAIAAVDDTARDGTQAVTITATAIGFPTATRNVSIVDNDVHHFTFAAIAAAQVPNVPFAINVSARDVNDVVITSYNSPTTLTAGALAVAPSSLTGWVNGVWAGNVSVGGAGTNVMLTANDGAGYTGTSNAFNLTVGALHHFGWSTIPSPQTNGTPFPVTITAQDAGNNTVTSFTGTTTLQTAAGGVQILSWVGYADTAAGSEYANTKTAISTHFPGYTETNTSVTDAAQLAAALAGKHVFLIPEQELASSGQMGPLGTAWAGVLTSFVNSGGIVIVCSWQYSEHLVLVNSGLMTATKGAAPTSASVTKTADTALNAGVATPFPASYLSEYSGSNGVVSLQTTAGNPVVLDRAVGSGRAVLIGTDFYTLGTGMDRIVANAVALAGSVGGGASLIPPVSGNFTNGVWSGNVAVPISGSVIRLRADDGASHLGDSNGFTVLAAPTLAVTPAAAFAASGLRGGPFSPAAQNYTLTNTGGVPLDWVATKTSAWLDLAPASGTLAAGASVTVAATINASANALAPTAHNDTITFANTTNGVGNTTRPVSLIVNAAGELAVTPAPGFTASGPYGGPFTPAVQTYTLTNSGDAPLDWTAARSQPWLALSQTSGTLAVGASTTVDVTHAAGTLAPGSHAATLTFTNTSNGRGNTTRPASLDITLPAPVLAAEPAITPATANTIAWSSVNGASDYEAQIATDAAFTSPGTSGLIPGTAHTFTGLSDSVQYYYRARARLTVAALAGQWTQTSQEEFATGTLASTTVSTVPGSVVLSSGTTWTENFDAAGTTMASTIFSNATANYLRDPLGTFAYYPNNTPPLPINQQGDSEVLGNGFAAMIADASTVFADGSIEGYVFPSETTAATLTSVALGLRITMGAPTSAYVAEMRRISGSSGGISITKFAGGTGTTIGTTSPSFPFEANGNYRLRFTAAGSVLTAQLWLVTTAGETPVILEGGQNTVIRTDSTHTSGVAGLFSASSVGAANRGVFDDITVTTGTAGYAAGGTLTSPVIAPAQWQRWGTLAFTRDVSAAGTGLTVDVLNAAGTVLATNVAPGTDLNTIAAITSQPSIRLRANLSTTNPTNTPRLDDWSVGYFVTGEQTFLSAWSNVETSLQFNAPPGITAIDNQVILEDAATAVLPFALGDDSTAPDALAFTVLSSNPALVPVANIALSGSGANRGVQVAPLADLHGTARVTLRVTDEGGKSSESAFDVVVAPVNDAPVFVRGANQAGIEDGAAQVVPGWATAISAGPVNESAQMLAFLVSHDRPALFAVAPALSPDGTLTYTPAPNANGTATVTVRLHDDGGTADGGSDTSAPQTFTIAIGAVNDAPSFVKGADQSALEDAGPQTIAGWATAISAGPANESAQTLDFIVSHDRPALFAVAPALSPDGTLTYTPAPDANGTATVTVRLHDDGGTADGGSDTSAPQTFTIAIDAVNDAPSFVKGANQNSRQNAGAQTVPGWATAISSGPTDEAAQTVSFDVTNDQPALFAIAPALSADGTLTYTPAADTTGTATVTVILRDNGGTADGGRDASAAQTFLISTTFVNDAPSFVRGSDLETAQDAGPQVVAAWATQISAGPADEAAQVLDFIVETDAAALFAAAPAIAPDGTLTYTPAPAASGTATITVRLHDNGGTADGGSDTSAAQTFTIAVTTFAEETGTYNGLVRAAPGTAPSAERAGVLRFALNRRGAFTSQLTLGGKTRAAKGRVDLSGVAFFGAKDSATWSFARGKGQTPLALALKVDVADGTDTLAGVVRDGTADFATIEADRALFTAEEKPEPPLRNVPPELLGRYTLAFLAPPPATPEDTALYPQGAGDGTLKLTADGRVRLAATLADGTKISADNALSKHLVFPLHHAAGRGQAISGPLAFRDVPAVSDVDGAPQWFRPARDGQFYPAGWPAGLVPALVGAKYTPPAKGVPMIPGLAPLDADGNAMLTLTDGGLLAPHAQMLGIAPGHRVTAIAPNLGGVTMKMNAKKGTFSGTFTHPVTGKAGDFQGVVLQKQAAGTGAFRTKTAAGGVSLVPQ